MQLTTEQRIKKAHIAMMKHPETALYSGVFMLGETAVTDEKITAYTDGLNKRYGRTFMDALTEEEVRGLVLHENLHIVFRHLLHNRDLFEEDRRLANMAADYVVNDVIVNLKDKGLCKLPGGALVDPQYHNMNMREVYRLLKDKCKKGGGGGSQKQNGSGNTPEGGGSQSSNGNSGEDYQFDEHDINANSPQNAEDAKEMDTRIDRAIREGALLAGRLGANIPRSIQDLLDPAVRWSDELKEFVTASMRGKDEYTWRNFNRRLLPNDIFLPTVENETIGEVVVAIDTSGSIGQAQIDEFASELLGICDAVEPEAVRVLWWDTRVHGEQVFRGNYEQMKHMLKPLGGGGTRVGCVSEYINRVKLKAECVIVFTDGYVENSPAWDIDSPTLWLVTQNRSWTPPKGRKVVFEK